MGKFKIPIVRDRIYEDALLTAGRCFPKLYEAFNEDGVLHNDNVFLFFQIESQLNTFDWRRYKIPVVVAITSPVPPPIKIGIKSAQMRENENEGLEFVPSEHDDIDFEKIDMEEIMDVEEIIEMKNTNLDWCRCNSHRPRSFRDYRRSLDFYMLFPNYRRGGRVFGLDDCVVYLNNPFEAEPFVEIVYQTETRPIFTSGLVTFGILAEDDRDSFQELVREKAEEAKRAYHEALQAQEKLIAQGINAADFENMRFYKFYPSYPSISFAKHSFINKYFGDAHQVF